MITYNLLQRIHNSGKRFLDVLTPEKTYEALIEEGKKISKAQWGSVFLPSAEGFKKVYASTYATRNVTPRKNGKIKKAFKTGKPIIYSKKDIEELKQCHPEFTSFHIKSAVIIPLSYGGESMGVVSFQSIYSRCFTKEKIKILELFCSVAFICIRKTELIYSSEKALELRDLFISLAAHELKTPLTSANLYASMLEKKLIQKDITESTIASSVVRELTRLTRIINEFLQIERIKRGQLEYRWEKCKISDVVERALVDFKQAYPFHKVIVKNNVLDVSVMGDFDKLLQVIQNLLHNAAKYSPFQKPIEMRLSADKSFAEIAIVDSGKGIAKKDIPKIVEKFYKGQNSLQEGMGLGLYLTKHIIEKHHGTLEIYSQIQKGTTATVRLPK